MKKSYQFALRLYLFVSKGPVYHYIYIKWRAKRWLLKLINYSYEVSDNDLIKMFKQPQWIKTAYSSQKKHSLADKDHLHDLVLHLLQRNKPRFYFTLEDIGKLTSLISTDQINYTINQANKICDKSFSFRGVEPVHFKDGVDWKYQPQGNKDWTWELNRHTYFETLGRAYCYSGDEKYVGTFQELITDWYRKNQANVNQECFSSVFEVSIRINTWIWSFYYFSVSNNLDYETYRILLKGLVAHGRYLFAHIEEHARNNHLLLEAKSLVMLGVLFPEFKDAPKWREKGFKTIYRQIKNQVCSDGVHSERATHYHQLVSSELLELFVLMDNNGLEIPSWVLNRFEAMIMFENRMTKPDGLIPLLGDSALNDSHVRFSTKTAGPIFLNQKGNKVSSSEIEESTVWLLGHERIEKENNRMPAEVTPESEAFPEGGYYIMRSGRDPDSRYLLFDCGAFSDANVPGHGHADALSFELYANGSTWIVDPGVYSTGLGARWRNFFRSTAAHNTVVVDGKDQSILLDTTRVLHPAKATAHKWISNEHLDFIEGSHNGYLRLSQPVVHNRCVMFVKPEYWVVIDTLSGTGKHNFDVNFHFVPNTETRLDKRTGICRLIRDNSTSLKIVPLSENDFEMETVKGSTNPIQGWVSYYSGLKHPATVLKYRIADHTPVQFTTMLYPMKGADNEDVQLSKLNLHIGEKKPADPTKNVGLCINSRSYIDHIMITANGSKKEKIFGNYYTDSEMLFIRRHRNEDLPEKIVMIEGSYLYSGSKAFIDKGEQCIDTSLVIG